MVRRLLLQQGLPLVPALLRPFRLPVRAQRALHVPIPERDLELPLLLAASEAGALDEAVLVLGRRVTTRWLLVDWVRRRVAALAEGDDL